MKRYSSLSQTVPEIIVTDDAIQTVLQNIQSGLPFVDFIYAGAEMSHVVQVNEQYRLDLIAYKYLLDYRAWPILFWYNNPPLIDPIGDVLPQVELFIPTDIVTLAANVIAFTYLGVEGQ